MCKGCPLRLAARPEKATANGTRAADLVAGVLRGRSRPLPPSVVEALAALDRRDRLTRIS